PEKGYEPLAFRYLALTAHYRSKLDFTTDAMTAATSGLRRLRRAAAEGGTDGADVDLAAEPMAGYRERFVDAISEDLGMPAAVAVAHSVASSSDLTGPQRRALLLDFDRVLGLSLDAPADEAAGELPDGAAGLLEQRAAARAARDFATSDRLRDELAAMGVEVRDTSEGQETTIRR
ncbi:MAG TPA: cysteine--tRNA ligase, partial [Candidatus Limnocylindria bacterium]|nr:cysteine--tRNA ligase [Candidatus Limnocylindria bacterium]